MITNRTFDEIEVGDSATVERTLTKNDIDLFGALSGDMNPTHFSDAYAEMLLDRRKVVGGRVPIILTSRADSAQARLASCAVAAAFAWSREGGVAAREEVKL